MFYGRGRLTSDCTRRNLGMGPQPALPLSGEDCRQSPHVTAHGLTTWVGCSSIDSIPIAAGCTSCASPLLHLPSGYATHLPSDPFITTLLDHYPWLCASGPGLGNITPVISRLRRRLFRTPPPASVTIRPLSLPCNPEKGQFRRSSGTTRWQVR